MLQIVRRNFGLKVVSLALAIVGWGYFRYAANPVIAARFTQQLSVPVTIVNQDPGELVRFTDRQAVVTIAPKRGDAPVKPEEIRAVIDLAKKGPGIYNVPIQLVAPNVAVQSLSPASVTLTIERIEQRSMPFSVHYVSGAQPDVVVGNIRLTPSAAMVRGPSSALAQVTSVRVDVQLTGNASGLDVMERPAAVNARGETVNDVTVVPNLVRVQADFAPASGKGR
jgi:YbbR domain-containing protein